MMACTPARVPRSSAGRRLAVLACAALLAACGGGSDGNGGGAANVAPVANAGPDRTVVEQSTVSLNGSATDANSGDTLAYAWSQVSGQSVTLSNANRAQASFLAPDVAGGAPQVLGFRLRVTDSAGAADTDDVLITVQEPGAAVTISGVASYEFVPANANCIGLNYGLTAARPIRQATVQVLDAASQAVLGDDTTDDTGRYAITVDAGRNVRLRVRAELKRGGSPSWDVEVRDNVTAAVPPAPLHQRPLYVLDSAAFDSGGVDQVRNLTAATGWGGTSYTGTRAAAPFAVLDAIYSGMQLVLGAQPTANFVPLDAFWSPGNKPVDGSGSFEDNIASGEIGTSFYSSGIDSLFLLGQAGSDTEEFDDHVIVHEWGHYFEDVFARSDSIGGSHGPGDRLDMRVAFGEGWATALSGMALGSPRYCDTQGTAQANGFEIDIENDAPNPRGWFNEFSVMSLIYDVWDTAADGGDNDSLGFGPIFDTMTGPQAVTPAHTSIFSFVDGLKALRPADSAFVDALRADHDINGIGIYGDGESNDASGGTPPDVLPVYTDIVPDGSVLNICSNRQFDAGFNGNRLSEYRFLRMAIVSQSRYTFDVVTDSATVAQLPPDDPNDDRDQSDPDLRYYLNGVLQNSGLQGFSGVANRETFTTANELAPGDYVLDVVEFRHTDENSATDFPERSCFDITITAAP